MKNILLVDDDRAICSAMNILLKPPKYKLACCGSIKEATSVLKGKKEGFDLILLDLMLPDGSGYSLLEKLRKGSKVPVIVISSNDTAKAAREAFKLGATDYVCKPFDVSELISIVEENLHG